MTFFFRRALAAWLLIGFTCAFSSAQAEQITTPMGRLQLDTTGAFRADFQAGRWIVRGTAGAAVHDLDTRSGIDAMGAYQEITFVISDNSWSGGIRSYLERPIVLFRWTALRDDLKPPSFPQITNLDPTLSHLAWESIFAHYQWGHSVSDSPQLLFDSTGRSLMFSPARNFLIAHTYYDAGKASASLQATVPAVPASFTHEVILAAGSSIHQTMDTWGGALLDLGGKLRPANNADLILERLGYWTDAGGALYYGFNKSLGYQGTLISMKEQFAKAQVPLGYLQLDSWWYPKGPLRDWRDRSHGIDTFTADTSLFPDDLSGFQQRLGVPLIVHARWIDDQSPYRAQYAISGNVVTEDTYWRDRADYFRQSGVVAFEQDWMGDKAQPVYNLKDPDAFLDSMANAMQEHGITMQYCMALPRHFLQSTRYSNLTHIRVSMDRFEREKWDEFLYASRLASALGTWPWADVTFSRETHNLLLMTLSGGPVGVGDEEGRLDVPNLRKVARTDGVIVKPDSPIIPRESSILADAADTKLTAPMVASTFTDFGGAKVHYIFAYSRAQGGEPVRVVPADYGLTRALLWDTVAAQAHPLMDGESYTATLPATAAYFVMSPIGPSGISLLGDLGHFVPAGHQRIGSMTDQGTLRFTVLFAPGETLRTITAWAPAVPTATVADGGLKNLRYDANTKLVTFDVSPGNGSSASIELKLP